MILALLVGLAAWLIVALLLGLLGGRMIRTAEEEERPENVTPRMYDGIRHKG